MKFWFKSIKSKGVLNELEVFMEKIVKMYGKTFTILFLSPDCEKPVNFTTYVLI